MSAARALGLSIFLSGNNMSSALSISHDQPRSLVEERAPRAPTIGKIRPGIKALKSAARNNTQAVKLYNDLVAKGESFDTIADVIERQCNIRNPLVPKNVDYFTCRRADFANPDVADEIMRLYGEDRGQGVRLYKFPVLFPFNDWLQNVPNEMAAFGTNGRKFFSIYQDGIRHCKMYQKVEVDPKAQRAKRLFGGRQVVSRQDDHIPDGICNPEMCPQYQSQQCRLTANFVFAIPDIKGLGLIELPTNSFYVLKNAYSAMQLMKLARGRLAGTRFWLTKREEEVTRLDELGEPVRVKQMLTTLDAEVDIGALLDAEDDSVPALIDESGETKQLAQVIVAHAEPVDGQLAGPTVGESDASGSSAALIETSASDVQGAEPTGQPSQALVLPEETVEDKRERMSDLLKRLGVTTEELQKHFGLFASTLFNKGWTKHAADLDAMNERLVGALLDPEQFLQEMSNTARDILSPV
jgi:Recombination directionality factor-like